MKRPCTIFALFAITSALCGADLADELRQMVGRNLEQLPRGHSKMLSNLLQSESNQLVKIGQDGFDPASHAWHVWSYRYHDLERFVVFAGHHIYSIPGNSYAQIVLLDATAKVISRRYVLTGWRVDILGAKFSYDQTFAAHIIDISTNSSDIARQIFAILDDSLLFIGVKDRNGKLVRNNYSSPNYTLGGELPVKNVTDWVALLRAPEIPRRLAALTYLAGKHMDPMHPREHVYSESVEDAKIAVEFRDHPETRRLLEQYRHEKHPWVAEAASLAFNPATDD